MSVTMADQSKAMRLARQLVKPFDTGDIQSLIFDHLDWKSKREPLCKAVDPSYIELLREQQEIQLRLSRNLRTEEDRDALERYSDVCIQLQAIIETASFHIGFAAALRFLGQEAALSVVGRAPKESKPKATYQRYAAIVRQWLSRLRLYRLAHFAHRKVQPRLHGH